MSSKIVRKQIVLRVPASIKKSAAAKARKEGLSLNAYCERVLSR